MKFFIDTAKVEDIRKANDMGVICGVTTNPSLIAKEGRVFEEEMIPPSLREVLEGKMEGEEWYFTEEGVRFISNIYEIAPYAEGETLYDIPYELVNDVLKEEYRR